MYSFTSIFAAIQVLAMLQFSSYPQNAPDGHWNLTIDSTDFVYSELSQGNLDAPEYDIFCRAMVGYRQLRHSKNISDKEIITIIDFRKSANDKRLWVIDLKRRKIIYHSLVAHGRNSGWLYPDKFSNRYNSYQSSLGFFITGKTYMGEHGISLKLYGIEKGANDQAENRAIVMHGADYVSERYIRENGRLGRSQGCPAIPTEFHRKIITELAGRTCLFAYYPDKHYLTNTEFKQDNDDSFLASTKR